MGFSMEAVRNQPLVVRIKRLLPSGYLVPQHTWQARHNAVLILIWLQVPVIVAFGLLSGHALWHTLFDCSIVAVPAVIAANDHLNRRARSLIATFGLMSTSTVFVDLANGSAEMHFHFFVMLAVVALYQDWAPFLFSIAYVVIHHSVMGVLMPESVFSHQDAREHPFFWAGIYGGFVLANSVANLAAWKISERYTLYDPLTDLANRSLFRDRLEQTLSRSVALNRAMAVLYVDLDHFKAVNDRLGHDAGDQVLIEVGERLKACVRSTDTVARLGGDEYAVILAEVTSPDQATVAADRIVESLSQPFSVAGDFAQIGASVGIAIGRGTTDAADVVKVADEAMYSAKADGRGRYKLMEIGLALPDSRAA